MSPYYSRSTCIPSAEEARAVIPFENLVQPIWEVSPYPIAVDGASVAFVMGCDYARSVY